MGLDGAIEDICPTPQFVEAMFRKHDPGEKSCWIGRGEWEGQWLTAIPEGEKVRWVLWYIDFSELYRSFDVPEPKGQGGAHHPDGVSGEELGERTAARWLDDNGYDLPAILMGRTLGSGPTSRPATMRREGDIPASRSVTRSTEGVGSRPPADSSPGDPATAGATHTAKGTPKGPGRRRKTKLTNLENEVWTLYEKHREGPSPLYEIADILRPRFPGLTHDEVDRIVRKVKARKGRASRKPAPRGR
jgi:hypothetical protein